MKFGMATPTGTLAVYLQSRIKSEFIKYSVLS